MSPRRSPDTKRRRTKSLGGMLSPAKAQPAALAEAASRPRQPRKSAIRSTPQVFQSPTELGPNPEHQHMRGRDVLDELVDERLRSPGLPNPFAAMYRASSASPIKVPATDTADRKSRRVTFSAVREQTDFEQDEPTMSIKPAQAQERSTLMDRGSPVPNGASSDESDVSMSLESDGTMELTAAWQPDPPHDESDMELTGRYTAASDDTSAELDSTQTMDLTAAYVPEDDSQDTTLDSEAERSAMEMTEMWGQFADEATRQRREASLSPKRSPVRRQTMFLSPDRKARTASAGSTPKARAPTPEPIATPPISMPSTPTRFRQSLRGGVPSPEYKHSPARRTPRVRLSEFHTKPRSPFIHSLLKHRSGGRITHTLPRSDSDSEAVSETSFHMQLADFLGVIGLKFHEDMTASRTHAERPGDNDAPAVPAMAVHHAKMAGAAAPMLQALRNACQELKQHVEDGRERLRAMEQDFFARPPAFVQEWGQLDDEDMRRSMKGQLNVHKQAARAAAMHDYYGWRTDMQYDDEIVAMLTQHRDALQADAERVHARREELEVELLPALRARHTELKRRVHEAHARQQAIRACDPEELRHLHASMDEQDHVLQTMRAKQHDVADQLSRVRARLDETAVKREQTEELIRAARVVSDQIHGCTSGEAVRLERRIRHLEVLFQWRLSSKTSTLLQLVYARALTVAIELDGRQAGVKRVAISPVCPVEASHMHMAAISVIRTRMASEMPASVPEVLRQVAQLWHTYVKARAQVDRLRLHVPVVISPSRADKGPDTILDVMAAVLLERAQAKAHVHVDIDLARASPLSSQVHVSLVYGHMDTDTLAHMIQSALAKDAHSPHALAYAITHAQATMDT